MLGSLQIAPEAPAAQAPAPAPKQQREDSALLNPSSKPSASPSLGSKPSGVSKRAKGGRKQDMGARLAAVPEDVLSEALGGLKL